MEYLKTEKVTVCGHDFEIRELSYKQFQDVTTDEEKGQLKAIQYGCHQFEKMELDQIAELPTRIVSGLSSEIAALCMPEDVEGN